MNHGIHHVAVRVSDLERSIAFYAEHFDLSVVHRSTLASGALIAFLAHRAGGAQLELIAGLDDHHRGDGLVHHVAFRVDDVEAAVTRLVKSGSATIADAPLTQASGRTLATVRGPDGERVQLVSS